MISLCFFRLTNNAVNNFKIMPQDNIHNESHVSEIIDILNEINEDIIHLHRYAAEDFTLMRSVFRENNYKAEKLEQSTKKAFDLIGSSKNSEMLVQKMDEYLSVVHECNVFMISKIESLTRFADEMQSHFEQMLIPVKNLNQRIVSLKLVLVNIKFPSCSPQSKTEQNDPDLICNKIRSLIISLNEEIESTENLLESLKNSIGLIKKPHMEQLSEFLDQINRCKDQYVKKHNEALLQIPELSAKIIDNIGNSHKIIIELQYHDIIRQKIEHVQESHNQIIQQLTQYQNNSKAEEDNELITYLIHVGEIVRIQASQLLQANKEYESAIDTISEELLSFSDNMTGITNLCKKLSITDTSSSGCGIQKTINENARLRVKMFESNQHLDEIYFTIKNEITSMLQCFTGINAWIDRLNSSLISGSNGWPEKEEHGKISDKQIRELSEDLTSTAGFLSDLFDKISETSQKHYVELTRNDTRNELDLTVEKMKEHELKFLPELNQTNETISAVFDENGKFTGNLADDILAAIRSIKYYDYFDKLADKIIQKLSYISEKYYTCNSVNDKHVFEYYKQKYTMNSERKIHDNVLAKNNGNFELFEEYDDPAGSNKNELF